MPEEKLVRKTYIAKAEVDDDERTVKAVISTSAVDREKEVLLPKGADFEQYKKNPVVLWAHDYRDTPIAKALWIQAKRKTIEAKIRFAETEKAEEIYQLFKGGYLNAFSVGFLPAEGGSHPPTPDEVKKNPEWAEARRIYDKWELLEFSAVPVPANPEALATAVKSKDISISQGLQDELGIEDEVTYYADTIVAEVIGGAELEPVLKPEETDDYIRVPVRDCKATATITISAKEGIKGLYCGKIKKVRTYLFAKAKGWTMAKAKAWVKEHDSGKGCDISMRETVKLKLPPVRLKQYIDVAEQVRNIIKKLKGRMY